MSKKTKELQRIRYERERLLEALSKTPKDSEKYKKILDNLKELADVEETVKGKINWKDCADILLKLASLGLAGGQILAMIYLGKLSYSQEQSMSIKNGSVWNTAMKLFMNSSNKV